MQELMPDAILYKCYINDSSSFIYENIPNYQGVYDSIKKSIEIDNDGYNLYIIDDCSDEKLNAVISYINKLYEDKGKTDDICYVIYDDEKSPKPVFLKGGMGKVFKNTVESLIDSYMECCIEFYNNEDIEVKAKILGELETVRNETVNSFLKTAHDNGFQVKSTDAGFAFLPIDDNKDEEISDKANIITMLKKEANDMLLILKEKEIEAIDTLREVLIKYFEVEMEDIRKNIFEQFYDEENALNYFKYIISNIERKISDNYTISLEQDESGISTILSMYKVNVLVDNDSLNAPPVIYENDPTSSRLIGSIEYINHNGNYDTDSMLIKAGSILKANGGCLIMKTGSLISNAAAYQALKKVFSTKKIAYDYNRSYLEILSLGYINPEPISVNTKVILIGSLNDYYMLYKLDDDFKNNFKLKSEYDPVINLSNDSVNYLNGYINYLCENYKCKISDDAVKEIARVLSKKAESQNKLYFDDLLIEKMILLSAKKIAYERKTIIEKEDIINSVYDEEIIEKELLDSFKDGKILLNINDKAIGQINGLSVLDGGYFRFGRTFKITCSCISGSGEIVDIQKESSLSGRIHNKSVSILKGYINSMLCQYEKLPVDFHICFEQIYGRVEGDSASVAEALSMISAISKVPIKQNIAVTGSINQFGEIQPIGGVNEKIEGFYKICKSLGDTNNKGVLIPYLNKDDLVLSPFVEEAVEKGEFHIYVMNNMDDAIETMMGRNNFRGSDVLRIAKRELKKYFKKEN